MKKLSRKNLDELAKMMPVLSETEQRMFVGGSGNGYVYSNEEFQILYLSGNWKGGEVEDLGYISANGIPTDGLQVGMNGWFGSYYIGPTPDHVLVVSPTPVHAADYIAQQHDLEYKSLGLDGPSGTISPDSRAADDRLIQRCTELISLYESGHRTYCGYNITKQAYEAAKYMKFYFSIEQGITGIFQ